MRAHLAALVTTAVLALLHLGAPWLRRLRSFPEAAFGSFAGGAAVCLVFLHLLPEMAAGTDPLLETVEESPLPDTLGELAVYAIALAGFTTLYGLDRAAHHFGDRHPRGGSTAVFSVHLGAYGLYNALVTFTMPLRFDRDVDFAVLFAVAVGLHFLLTDRALERHYPHRFDSWGRLVLAGTLIAGWAAAMVVHPASGLAVSLMFAFITGVLLVNVLKEELPLERDSSFGWFAAGVSVYAALLAGAAALAAR